MCDSLLYMASYASSVGNESCYLMIETSNRARCRLAKGLGSGIPAALRAATLLLIPLITGELNAGTQNELSNFRIWNTGDGMSEGYISQVNRTPSGRILVRHGDVSAINILDGYQLNDAPDVQSLGRIDADSAGDLYTFDKSGALVYSGGKWIRYAVPEVAASANFGIFEHLRWFEYPFATDVHPRIDAIPTAAGKMLFVLASGVIEWSARDGHSRILRQSANSSIGDFIQVSAAGHDSFFVSGVHGLAVFTPETSGWSELPGAPAGFTRFTFPYNTEAHGIIMIANGADGRKRLLSFRNGAWQVLYTGGKKLRGWETDKRLWAMEPDRLISIGYGGARRVNLHPIVSGQLNDAVPDGDAFWLATTQGLARYTPPLWELPEGAPDLDATVNTIAQDKRGTLWFSSGAFLISRAGDKWRTYKLPGDETQNAGKTGNVCPMDNGRLILATDNESHLLEMDPATALFRSISHPEGGRIEWIERRDGNSVWVETIQPGESTSRIEIFDGTRFFRVPGADAVPITDVRALLRDRRGVIWVGGTGNLVRIVNGRLETIRKEEGLAEISAFSLLEGPDGTIYIGQRDSISAYDGSHFRVLRNGMDRARRLAISADGALWVASGTGVHRYKKGIWLSNASEEGLPSTAAYTVFTDRTGTIWAGTTLGLSQYHPERDHDAPVTLIQENRNVRKAPPGGEVRLVFSGIDKWKQTPEQRLLFSWKLDGGSWSAFDPSTLAAIQTVPSGPHLFQVRAMDRSGNIDLHPALFQFTVLFPWYRENGFYAVTGLLALAIGLLLRRGYTYHRNLRFQSRHDSLTGLPNRLHFEEALTVAMEKPYGSGTGLAVLFIDLDGFKAVNDTQGHLAGDNLLIAIGAGLRSCLQKGDVLARIGGDEFALLHSSGDNREEVSRMADRILAAVRGCSPPASSVSASVGISLAPEHGTSASVLVRLADLAMYQSKSHSGDCRVFYDPGLKVDFGSAKVAGMIRSALKDQRCVLWYQPIVDYEGRVVRMEALARIDDPQRGLLTPGSFIRVAEETGLIHALGNWVLREAASTARRWRENGCEIAVAVNISPVQLDRATLADEVLDMLQEFGLPPTALTIEITEGAIARNQVRATGILNRLKKAGVIISLDDFGTGYSTLSMLDALPLDEIKLDRSFAASISGERTRDVVSQTVKLARKLNIGVVAEGIEEASQMQTARELGCALFQGFLIAPPLNHEMATQLIAHQSVTQGSVLTSPQ